MKATKNKKQKIQTYRLDWQNIMYFIQKHIKATTLILTGMVNVNSWLIWQIKLN